MAAKFYPAPAVKEVADALIEKHHHHLLNHGVRMEYVFRNDVPTRAGNAIWGTARKVSSLNAFLASAPDSETGEMPEEEGDGNDPFFCIVISRPIWNDLTPDLREALVDHELEHCWAEYDDEGKTRLSIRGHDLEEFVSIVHRHGMWRKDIERFANACGTGQMSLEWEEQAEERHLLAELRLRLHEIVEASGLPVRVLLVPAERAPVAPRDTKEGSMTLTVMRSDGTEGRSVTTTPGQMRQVATDLGLERSRDRKLAAAGGGR